MLLVQNIMFTEIVGLLAEKNNDYHEIFNFVLNLIKIIFLSNVDPISLDKIDKNIDVEFSRILLDLTLNFKGFFSKMT